MVIVFMYLLILMCRYIWRAQTQRLSDMMPLRKKNWGEHCLPSSFVCDVMERKKRIVICKSSKYCYLGRKHHIHLLVLTLLALGVMKHLPVWNFHGSKVCWRHEQLIVSCSTSLVFSSWHPSFLHVPLLHLLYD